ncbi:hypothetical protein LBMAG53_30950 [Planctomycetota bacterium]|nr:hypothetical protein LBMAG53_30950 [Planctomycetota bacterium]
MSAILEHRMPRPGRGPAPGEPHEVAAGRELVDAARRRRGQVDQGSQESVASPAEAADQLNRHRAERGKPSREPQQSDAAADPSATPVDLLSNAQSDQPGDSPGGAPGEPPSRRRRRRAAKPPEEPAAESAAELLPSQRDGEVGPLWEMPWNWLAGAVTAAAFTIAVVAIARLPDPPPVVTATVEWLPGPCLAEREWKAWLRSFPAREQIPQANDWLLERLAAHLAEQPAVAEVARVALVPSAAGARELRLSLRLRQPLLPVATADGRRAWIAADGVVLPQALPPPPGRPPVLVGHDSASAEAVRTALDAWLAIRDRVEPGLITEIRCADDLDDPAHGPHRDGALHRDGAPPAAENAVVSTAEQRGVVLVTRQGTRLVWGRPGDERFGVDPAAKATALIAGLRSAPDLGRYASLDVRFGAAFLTVRP